LVNDRIFFIRWINGGNQANADWMIENFQALSKTFQTTIKKFQVATEKFDGQLWRLKIFSLPFSDRKIE
jgi:hypothetical protein